MSEISVILAFVHPLAVIVFATVWTLHILRNDYKEAVEQVTAEETEQDQDVPSAQG
jgi:hypothetical protein